MENMITDVREWRVNTTQAEICKCIRKITDSYRANNICIVLEKKKKKAPTRILISAKEMIWHGKQIFVTSALFLIESDDQRGEV